MTNIEILSLMQMNNEAQKHLCEQHSALYNKLLSSPGFVALPLEVQVRTLRDNSGLFAAVRHYRESFSTKGLDSPGLPECKKFVDSL